MHQRIIACQGDDFRLKADKAVWIWYPGDFEIWLHNKVLLRRSERGTSMPPFWRLDNFYPSIKFRKRVNLYEPELIRIYAEGDCTLILDNKYIYDLSDGVRIPAGEHELVITAASMQNVPCIYVEGSSIYSDQTWEASHNNHTWVEAGCWDFSDPTVLPSSFKLETVEIFPEAVEGIGKSRLVDFGKETFGYVKLTGVGGRGTISLYYGESREEALAGAEAETFDKVLCDGNGDEELVLSVSRAFRFINIVPDSEVTIKDVSAYYEFLPIECRGGFRCSDELVNRIWDTSLYTLHLNTREFFLDGIKRDRWVWSGDAYQSYLMNYYTFFDEAVNRRTMIALRGKDPVESHINYIMDYSFYWFIGFYDYYMYTGDLDFIRKNYARMLSLMEFCLNRRNSEGMMEGYPEDWVFVDWAEMDKRGEVSTEQILFRRSLEVMGLFAGLLGDTNNAERFNRLADDLEKKITCTFWDEEQGGFIQSRFEGRINRHLTKYPNIFSVLFGYTDKDRTERIKRDVLQNPNVQKITTPYMRFYELSALCGLGEQEFILKEMKDYWGGMLAQGATTFWEEYDPQVTGAARYAMYGRPFGKSLCHAWGASPVYLLGRYFLGVKPLEPGYSTYVIEPNLGGLDWIEGTVPIPGGRVNVFASSTEIRVAATKGTGCLIIRSSTPPKAAPSCKVIEVEPGLYNVTTGTTPVTVTL